MPPIIYYVNSSYSGNLIYVPLNQTFCPENSTIQSEAAAMSSFPYFSLAALGEEFTYSIVYNGTPYDISSIYVSKPFRLVSYSTYAATSQLCVGYPNAKNVLRITIAAPNYTYAGKLLILIYGKR